MWAMPRQGHGPQRCAPALVGLATPFPQLCHLQHKKQPSHPAESPHSQEQLNLSPKLTKSFTKSALSVLALLGFSLVHRAGEGQGVQN